MSGVRIIAVLGSSKAGKSTTAQYLCDKHGFTRVRFAQPLKDMLKALGLTDEQVDGPQAIREAPLDLLCGKSPRFAMQMLGTEWRDLIGKALWARITRSRISHMIEQGITKFVIDDMRFPHEAEMFREIGCEIIAIRRPEMEPRARERIWSALPLPDFIRALGRILLDLRSFHISETAWFGIERDSDIDNTGDTYNLYNQIERFLSCK